MSKQLLIDFLPFEITPQILSEARGDPTKPLRVTGPLQRANQKNHNGRVYPKALLEREAKKYAELVSERRALGELDHPECHRPGTYILGIDGWKLLESTVIGELVATLNPDTGTIEYNPIDRIINQPYTGKMISIRGKNIDSMVTPNHRFILKDRNGKLIEKTAQEIFDLSKTTCNPHLSIPTTASDWIGQSMETYTLPALTATEISINTTTEFKATQTNPLVLNAVAWFSFLGFYLAEGHVTNRDNHSGYSIFITQNRGEISDAFRSILTAMSPELEWKENDKNGSDSAIIFSTSDARLHTYLAALGNKYTKYIPRDIKAASVDLLQCLYEWFLNGDGTVVGEYSRTSIFSVSKRLMEDFNEVILKLGMSAVLKEQISKQDYMFAGHLIEVKNKQPLYRLWIKESKAIHLDFRFIKIEEVDYSGTVHCITVKNGTFYCRDHGKCFWSGNSAIINLKNVSHNVVELTWNGDSLMGTIEILTTPSGNIARELIKNNIRLGISSRGLGSVKDINENTVEVQEDFELLAFDLVSTPSTRGAYMNLTEGVLIEGSGQKKMIPKNSLDKYLKVETIIRDILGELK